MMKHRIATLALAFISALSAHSEGLLGDVTYSLHFGYAVGGTSPIGMPATIRSLDSYRLAPNYSLGLGINKPLTEHWGVASGLFIENKGMNIKATVKNYKMTITRGGETLAGRFTGHNSSKAEQWMLTLPVQATYSFNHNISLRLGAYASYVCTHHFDGYASDGYLRVDNPTGPKVELGTDETTRGSYDFSEDMRNFQFGVIAGADWYFHRRWGAFADITWGVTGIFKRDFKTIEQTLYPIYGTIGIAYKLK